MKQWPQAVCWVKICIFFLRTTLRGEEKALQIYIAEYAGLWQNLTDKTSPTVAKPDLIHSVLPFKIIAEKEWVCVSSVFTEHEVENLDAGLIKNITKKMEHLKDEVGHKVRSDDRRFGSLAFLAG